MKKHYTQTVGLTQQLRQLGLTALLAGGATVAAHAQTLAYTPASVSNVTGTYNDLGTSGTAISTANTDDANSAAQNIGFSFTYNGTAYTQFVLNTNGYLKLGSTAPAAPYFYTSEQVTTGGPLNSSTEPNLLLPFNTDLTAGAAGTEYRVATTGVAGSRVCTIQWKNVSDKTGTIPTQYANISFQVKLYEGGNQIEYVYGNATSGTGGANYRTVAVGLKGSNATTNQLLTIQKPSTGAWTSAVPQVGDYPVQTGNNAPTGHNVRAGVLPDAGRTYRFNLPTATDAAGVAAVYTLGKISSPAGLPHAVSARVTNTGTAALTNLQVTLSVTGANTFSDVQTVPSLAAGASATVTFASYPATLVAGTNIVTVSVPADGNNTNMAVTQQQLVSATTFSYIDPSQTTATGGGVGFGTGAGILAAKFTLSAARTVNSVSAFIVDPATVGRTIYTVVLSSAGTIVGRSADYVVVAADINTTKTFTLTAPTAVPAGDFYVGLAQTAFTAVYYPLGTQNETPTRPGTFYIAPLAGGAAPTDVAGQGFGRFMLEAITSTTTAISPELMRAVTVYPNPSADGVFNLAIAGANAQKGLQVEVVNTLGQRVYAGSARDNFTTQLDLSNLANGLYHLKVKNGDEYMQRQISVVK